MKKEDLVKYGLMLAAAYLVYQYIQSHGGFAAVLGFDGAAPGLPGGTAAQPPSAQPPAATIAAAATHPAAALDLTGLVVVRDVNNSLAGTVKINGAPTRIAIIQTDGRIFNSAGQEITESLAASGVDVNQLRQAFAAAGAGLAGFAPASYRPSAVWLM